MRVFVTGATGFVGSAVVQELLKAGHQVLGLARSEQAAKTLQAAGAEVHLGSLEDPDSLQSGARAADGVIHTGFNHDFSRFQENCELDRRAITALGKGLSGSDRPLIITSGIGLLAPGKLATEADRVPETSHNPRIATEQAADALLDQGINVSLLRLPPSVHGKGDHGFVPFLIQIAKDKGQSAYIAEGLNRWSAVERFDAAKLYRLALEKATPGARYHGVAEEGIAFFKIAEVIARRLKLPLVSLKSEEAAENFTWFEHFARLDCPTSSVQTREQLNWQPKGLSLLADIDQESYFLA